MHYALFETAIGTCAVVWGEHGVRGVHLPGGNPARTRTSVAHRFPAATPATPPSAIQRAIDAIVALLRGEKRDLRDIVLDFDGVPDFHRRVYELARTIGPGATLTYGDIALRLGRPGTARAVGWALGHNPYPIIVPCHRVLAANGRMGGFSAPGGVATKRRMLEIEGVDGVRPSPRLF